MTRARKKLLVAQQIIREIRSRPNDELLDIAKLCYKKPGDRIVFFEKIKFLSGRKSNNREKD